MIRAATAIAAVLLIGLIAPAVNGQEPETPGRYQMTADGEGFLRLDTLTGAISYCRLVDGRWRCDPADATSAPAGFAALADRVAALEAEIAALGRELRAGLAAAGDGSRLDALAAQLAGLEAMLAERADSSALGDELSRLGERQAALEQAVTTLLGELGASPDPAIAIDSNAIGAQLEQRLAPVAEQLAGVIARQEAIETALAEAMERSAGESETNAMQFSEMEATLDALSDDIDGMIAATATAHGEVLAAIAALDQRLGEIEDSVAAAPADDAEQLGRIEAELSALAASINETRTVDLAAIAAELEALAARQEALILEVMQTPPPREPLADLDNNQSAGTERPLPFAEELVRRLNDFVAALSGLGE